MVDLERHTAIKLSVAIEQLEGVVIGPVSTVSEALARLEETKIEAAILEANLTDCDMTPVALLLAKRRVPFLIHTAATVHLQ